MITEIHQGLMGSIKIAAGNRHRAFSFDRTMKFGYHHCSQRQIPVAVPELWRWLETCEHER